MDIDNDAGLGVVNDELAVTSKPNGGLPPIHMPFFLEAAILSRMRSPVTSRSNWAKDKRTFRVSRPMLVVVLNCWVIDTNERPRRSKTSTSLARNCGGCHALMAAREVSPLAWERLAKQGGAPVLNPAG